MRRTKKVLHDTARGFVVLGGQIREVMQTAMDVRVFALIGARHAIDHPARFLCACPVVEIDERLTVDL